MKITMLGCGGSFGSPLAWNRYGNIDIKNKKNFRTRSSLLLEINSNNILIDTSPDLRQQLYNSKTTDIDAVFYTHIHSDHTSGINDLRAMSLINNNKNIPAYIPKEMQFEMTNNYKYIFSGDKSYQSFMKIEDLKRNFTFKGVNIQTFKHNHGLIDAHTYRINNFAYSTDIKNFYENDIDKLKNLDVWIVGLLRYDDHPSHAGFNKILEYIDYLKPKKTVFTHMTALLDYKELSSNCPINVTPGYDGLIINI